MQSDRHAVYFPPRQHCLARILQVINPNATSILPDGVLANHFLSSSPNHIIFSIGSLAFHITALLNLDFTFNSVMHGPTFDP
jgi:hypothetical protein